MDDFNHRIGNCRPLPEKLPWIRLSPLGVWILLRCIAERSGCSRGQWNRVFERRFHDPRGLHNPTSDPIEPCSGLRHPVAYGIGRFLDGSSSIFGHQGQVVLQRGNRVGQWTIGVRGNRFGSRETWLRGGRCRDRRVRIGSRWQVARGIRRWNARGLIPRHAHHGVGLTTGKTGH